MLLSSEKVVSELLKFVIEQGRLPVQNEPGLRDVVEGAIEHFGSLENSLVIAGLLPADTDLGGTSLKETIKQILVSGPMTIKEIRKELRKFSQLYSDPSAVSVYQAIKNAEVKSIGPRRRRLYFLPGQEVIAQEKLAAALHGFSEEDIIIKNKILDHLKYPMTKPQIEALFVGGRAFQKSSKISKTLKELQYSSVICSMKFVAGARGGKKYSSNDLFGKLACKKYYCRIDSSEGLCQLLAANIPLNMLKHKGFRNSLSHHLRRILPKEISSDIISHRLIEAAKEELQAGSTEQANQDDFLESDEIEISVHCLRLEKNVVIRGEAVGREGSKLLRVVECLEKCNELKEKWCLVGNVIIRKVENKKHMRELLTNTIIGLLNGNPMKFGQIYEKVRRIPGFADISKGEIASVLFVIKEIKWIGCRRNYTYCLEGQENLA